MRRVLFSFALLRAIAFAALAQAPPAPAPAAPAPAAPAVANPASGEAQRCEERIASVQRDVLSKYDAALSELQTALQKAADLEGALAVRTERERAVREGALTEAHFVAEPKTLRALQIQTASKAQELISYVVQETVPRLVEMKKQLTVAGRLDEAVAVRGSIERLQNNFLAVIHPDPGTPVSADAILRAYAADKTRADAVYKGQKVMVRGSVVGFRQDPADSKQYLIYIASGTAPSSWVTCAFPVGEYRFREEKQFTQILVVSTKDNDPPPLRLQRGSAVDVVGTCAGWEDTVRLNRCEFAK